MIKSIFSSIVALVVLSGCGAVSDDDTYSGIDIHNQGDNCLRCHATPASQADGEDFISGGTVFTTLSAAITDTDKFASNHKIKLLFSNATTTTFEIDKGTGNSFTESALDNTLSFTAQVIDSTGTVVNSSNTDSHSTLTHLDCNSCHTAAGTDSAPGRIVSYNYYASLVDANTSGTTISFATDVMPVLSDNCFSCHKNGDENFDVSTASTTFTNLGTYTLINTADPVNSQLLLKGSGSVSHNGGTRISTTSTGYATIRDWITQGALNN